MSFLLGPASWQVLCLLVLGSVALNSRGRGEIPKTFQQTNGWYPKVVQISSNFRFHVSFLGDVINISNGWTATLYKGSLGELSADIKLVAITQNSFPDYKRPGSRLTTVAMMAIIFNALPETNIAMENPQFWWYLPGKMGFSWAMLVSGRVVARNKHVFFPVWLVKWDVWSVPAVPWVPWGM